VPLLTLPRPAPGGLLLAIRQPASYSITPVTVDQEIDWAVQELLSVRDQAIDWAVYESLTVDLATDWTVQVCLAVRDRGFDWAVRELLEVDLTTDWTIVDENLITVDLATDWIVRALVTRDLATDWAVARKTVAVPDPVGDILAEFNGIDLNNGTTTHIGRAGASLGAMPAEYDAVRGAFGEWQQNEVKQGWATTAITVDVRFTTTALLTAWIKDIKTACRAGGTLTWQWDADDVVRTYRIGASSEPEIIEDNAYILQHRTTFVLALVRWPS